MALCLRWVGGRGVVCVGPGVEAGGGVFVGLGVCVGLRLGLGLEAGGGVGVKAMVRVSSVPEGAMTSRPEERSRS